MPPRLTLPPLAETHPLFRQQQQLLGRDAGSVQFDLPASPADSLPPRLLAALRARVISSQDAYFACPPSGTPACTGGGSAARISAQNERLALQLARRLITEQFPDGKEGACGLAAVEAALSELCAPANEKTMAPLTDATSRAFSAWLDEWNVSDAAGLGQETGAASEEDDLGLRRGVVALRDVAPGEHVFKVPIARLINADTALQSEIGHVFVAARALLSSCGDAEGGGAEGRGAGETSDAGGQGLHDDTIAMLFLLYQRAQGASSRWRRYFDHLPRSICTGLCPDGLSAHGPSPQGARASNRQPTPSTPSPCLRPAHGPCPQEGVDIHDGPGHERRGGGASEPGPVDWWSEMAGTPLMARSAQELAGVKATYETLFPRLMSEFPEVFTAESFSYRQFLWARLVFDTRCVTVKFPAGAEGGDGRDVTCLVPCADMCNHHPQAQIAKPALDSSGQHLCFTSLVAIPAGAQVRSPSLLPIPVQPLWPRPCTCVLFDTRRVQVYLNYGPLDNTELLLYYGYAYPNNPFDAVGVDLQPPDEEEDALAAEKASMMAHSHLPTQHLLRRCHLSPSLLATLRLLLLEPSHLQAASLDGVELASGPLHPDHERAVLGALQGIVRATLDGFGSSAPHDEALLSRASTQGFLRCLVVYRLELKRILLHTLGVAQGMVLEPGAGLRGGIVTGAGGMTGEHVEEEATVEVSGGAMHDSDREPPGRDADANGSSRARVRGLGQGAGGNDARKRQRS